MQFDDPRQAFSQAGMTVFERGWLSSNGILFLDGPGDVSTLVDTGYAAHETQTVALVRHALAGRPLARILNTHLHSDHCGGNAILQSTFGCEALVPSGELEKIRDWDELRLTYRATGQRCERFCADGALTPGESVMLGKYAWEVIASPGHDPESVILFQQDLRLLISADALWENGFGVVFPEIEGIEAFDQLGETLDRLAKLEVEWVVPGHGGVFGQPRAAIDRARRRLDGFRKDPAKHAIHAAKVLLKFHLLEVQTQSYPELHSWAAGVPYLVQLHERYRWGQSFEEWMRLLVVDLVRVGAARFDQFGVADAGA